MKTRNGFVSNSSSSSFVVKYKKMSYDAIAKKPVETFLLNEHEVKLLQEQDFTLSNLTHPSHVETSQEKWAPGGVKVKDNQDITLIKSVSCNQDEEMDFLVAHNIPFIANVHYGHQHVFFERDGKYVYILQNYGDEAETYFQGDIKGYLKMLKTAKTEPVVKIPVKHYVKSYAERLKSEN